MAALLQIMLMYAGLSIAFRVPAHFLREPGSMFGVKWELPKPFIPKELLDSKSSLLSSEFTDYDDSPDTEEESYQEFVPISLGDDYVDSNAAEENFDDSPGPVITLPKRRSRRSINRRMTTPPSTHKRLGFLDETLLAAMMEQYSMRLSDFVTAKDTNKVKTFERMEAEIPAVVSDNSIQETTIDVTQNDLQDSTDTIPSVDVTTNSDSVSTEESSTNTDEISVSTEETSSSTDEVSVSSEESSTNSDEISVSTEETSSSTDEVSVSSEESSTNSDEISVSTEESSTNTDEVSVSSEETSTNTDEVSASTDETSTNTDEISTNIEESSSITDEMSTTPGDSNTNAEETSTNTNEESSTMSSSQDKIQNNNAQIESLGSQETTFSMHEVDVTTTPNFVETTTHDQSFSQDETSSTSQDDTTQDPTGESTQESMYTTDQDSEQFSTRNSKRPRRKQNINYEEIVAQKKLFENIGTEFSTPHSFEHYYRAIFSLPVVSDY